MADLEKPVDDVVDAPDYALRELEATIPPNYTSGPHKKSWFEGRESFPPVIDHTSVAWEEDLNPALVVPTVLDKDGKKLTFIRALGVPKRPPPCDPFTRDHETGEPKGIRCGRTFWMGIENVTEEPPAAAAAAAPRVGVLWLAFQCGLGAEKGNLLCSRHLHAKGVRGAAIAAPASIERQTNILNTLSGANVKGPMMRLQQTQRAALCLTSDPGLMSLYHDYLNDEALYDFKPQVALGKALLHRYLEISNLNDPDRVVGIGTLLEAPALRAIGALEKVVNLGVKYLSYEKKLGAISHADLQRLLRALRRAVNRFLKDPKDVEEFYAILRSESRAKDDQDGIVID